MMIGFSSTACVPLLAFSFHCVAFSSTALVGGLKYKGSGSLLCRQHWCGLGTTVCNLCRALAAVAAAALQSLNASGSHVHFWLLVHTPKMCKCEI